MGENVQREGEGEEDRKQRRRKEGKVSQSTDQIIGRRVIGRDTDREGDRNDRNVMG